MLAARYGACDCLEESAGNIKSAQNRQPLRVKGFASRYHTILIQVDPPIGICRNINQEPMLRDLHSCYFSYKRLQRYVRSFVEPLEGRKTGVLGDKNTRSTSLFLKLGLEAVPIQCTLALSWSLSHLIDMQGIIPLCKYDDHLCVFDHR